MLCYGVGVGAGVFGALGALTLGEADGAGVASAANALAETPPRTRAVATAVARRALLVFLNILNLLLWVVVLGSSGKGCLVFTLLNNDAPVTL